MRGFFRRARTPGHSISAARHTRSRRKAKSARCSAAPPGVSQMTGAPASRTTAASRSGSIRPAPKLAWRSAPESNSSRLSLAVHQVDAAGHLEDVLDDGLERVAARVGVAGVEAEPDHVAAALGLGDGVEDAVDPLEVPRHRVVAAGGVLDQERELEVGRVDRLAPVVEADLGVVVAVDVAAVHDQALGAQRRRRVDVLLEQLARRDPDPVVRGGDVDDVGRVDVEVDPGRRRVVAQPLEPAGVPDLGPLVALRVAEEELHQVGLAGLRLRDRVLLLDVRADPGHGTKLSPPSDSPPSG